MSSITEKYLLYVETCKKTNYEDRGSIRKHNNAVAQMYALVENTANQPELKELVSLLDDDDAKVWLAHQLVEKKQLKKSEITKCFEIVENLIQSGAIGEDIWLNEWQSKLGFRK